MIIPRGIKDLDASLDNICTVRKLIQEQSKGKKGFGAELDCPICKKGKVKYGAVESNGHISASCSTEGCVAWME